MELVGIQQRNRIKHRARITNNNNNNRTLKINKIKLIRILAYLLRIIIRQIQVTALKMVPYLLLLLLLPPLFLRLRVIQIAALHKLLPRPHPRILLCMLITQLLAAGFLKLFSPIFLLLRLLCLRRLRLIIVCM